MGFSRQEYWTGFAMPSSRGSSQPGLPHCRWILYCLSCQGNLRILEWVDYPFSRGTSQLRNWTGVSCIAADLPEKPPLNSIWTGNWKIFKRNNKVGGNVYPISRHYIMKITKTIWYWERDKHRSMEQTRELRNRPTQICRIVSWQRCKNNSAEKR